MCIPSRPAAPSIRIKIAVQRYFLRKSTKKTSDKEKYELKKRRNRTAMLAIWFSRRGHAVEQPTFQRNGVVVWLVDTPHR